MPAPHPPADFDRWISFRNKGFRFYWSALIAAGFAVQIQTVAIGWQVYQISGDPFDLGLIGLSQFLPAILLVLVTGTVSDRFQRRSIMIICLIVEAMCALAFLSFTVLEGRNLTIVFAILAVLGTARAFYNPARQAIVPNLVPSEHLANAITLNTTAMQISTIAGPVAGGLLFGVMPEIAYATSCTLLLLAAFFVFFIPQLSQTLLVEKASWNSLIAGFRYIWKEKIVLGAITLDLFAVLLGGTVALLPLYAQDILQTGPWGLGLLRAGPAIGAIAVGFYLMAHPIRDRAGIIMFAAILFFGASTIVFGISETLWLSIAALVVMGGMDMISVYVRNTLIQLWTPDALRGRVNAVNQVFIGASNELGGFRSGVSAALFGAVAAVTFGGAGTIFVAALWTRLFPELRRVRQVTTGPRVDGTVADGPGPA
jgi:MFS family permease